MSRAKSLLTLVPFIESSKNLDELKTVRDAADKRINEIQSVYPYLNSVVDEVIGKGIDLDSLMTVISQKKGSLPASNRNKPAPKYRYVDESGKVYLWSGRGRMPVIFASLTTAGHSIEEYLIPPESDENSPDDQSAE